MPHYSTGDRRTIGPAFTIVGGSGVEILLTGYQASNMNAFAERFIRSIKAERLEQVIFVGQRSID